MIHLHKYGPVDERRIQCCTVCGLARAVPLPDPPRPAECEHKWEMHTGASVVAFGQTKRVVYLLQCTKCGDLKNHSFQ
jgi:hypothetical protein